MTAIIGTSWAGFWGFSWSGAGHGLEPLARGRSDEASTTLSGTSARLTAACAVLIFPFM